MTDEAMTEGQKQCFVHAHIG